MGINHVGVIPVKTLLLKLSLIFVCIELYNKTNTHILSKNMVVVALKVNYFFFNTVIKLVLIIMFL